MAIDLTTIKVGDKVKLLVDIYEPVSDDSPGGILAFKDEVVIVRATGGFIYDLHVSHAVVENNSFGILANEADQC